MMQGCRLWTWPDYFFKNNAKKDKQRALITPLNAGEHEARTQTSGLSDHPSKTKTLEWSKTDINPELRCKSRIFHHTWTDIYMMKGDYFLQQRVCQPNLSSSSPDQQTGERTFYERFWFYMKWNVSTGLTVKLKHQYDTKSNWWSVMMHVCFITSTLHHLGGGRSCQSAVHRQFMSTV